MDTTVRIPAGSAALGESYPERKMARTIEIIPLDYGFSVRVGCQNFAFETKEKLIDKLTQYLNDPAKVEADWLQGKFNMA